MSKPLGESSSRPGRSPISWETGSAVVLTWLADLCDLRALLSIEQIEVLHALSGNPLACDSVQPAFIELVVKDWTSQFAAGQSVLVALWLV